jgi:cellulose synthase/poly-beta-1,6-N-acetylglucosamine synthase-like glycosyltransferase
VAGNPAFLLSALHFGEAILLSLLPITTGATFFEKILSEITMSTSFRLPGSRFQWITGAPLEDKSVAILIPQFNEGMQGNMEERLHYLRQLSLENKGSMDVILIDDGSTDDSLQQIKDYLNLYPGSFYFASVYPNTQKVGALHYASLNIDHEYVVLSDFDTDLKNVGKLIPNLDLLRNEANMMGYYFRLVPFEGRGLVFLMQQLEYTMARIYYSFLIKESTVPVMPGAGACYKRKILLDVYRGHSGVRSGEDREATVLGFKLGYKALYLKEVEALTRPPLSFKALIVQRRRWYLGYLETFIKEKEFYISQMSRFTKLGVRTIQDVASIILVLLLPLELIATLFINQQLALFLICSTYFLSLVYYLSLIWTFPRERKETRKGLFALVLVFPLFWLLVSFISWWKAVLLYRSKKRKTSIKKNMPVDVKDVQEPVSEVINEL